MSKLSAIKIRNATPQDKAYKLSDGHGLCFHVAKSGRRTWRYRYKIAGTESTFVLGEYPSMTLEQARKARSEARELVKVGTNPARARREEKQAALQERNAKFNSFEFIALEWIEKQREGWTPNHEKAVLGALKKNIFPFLRNHPITDIRPQQLHGVIQKIEDRGALEIARKVLQRVNAVFMYAIRTGRADINPAASLQGALKTRRVQHMAALSREDMPDFIKALTNAKMNITTKLAMRFLILTAARTGEVRGATWDEVDIDGSMWRIPAKRMKMNNPHNVPLSKQAIEILEQIGDMFGRKSFIFPAIRNYNKPMSQNTMIFALHSLGYHSKATVHGFRATFSTIANESGWEGDVIEKALAHTERNRVRAAYHRSEYLDQRRELMQWWADLLQQMEHGAEIVQIGTVFNK